AAKYTPEGGNIWLEVEIAKGGVVVTVRDDGTGIEESMLPRIFELFVQTHRADSSTGGLGIGLTLVQRIVELHGGRVLARSGGPGRGAEFVVELPGIVVHHSHPTPAPVRLAGASLRGGASSSSPPALPPMRILVVEDNSDIRETLRDLLVMCGHQVEVAEDG